MTGSNLNYLYDKTRYSYVSSLQPTKWLDRFLTESFLTKRFLTERYFSGRFLTERFLPEHVLTERFL